MKEEPKKRTAVHITKTAKDTTFIDCEISSPDIALLNEGQGTKAIRTKMAVSDTGKLEPKWITSKWWKITKSILPSVVVKLILKLAGF